MFFEVDIHCHDLSYSFSFSLHLLKINGYYFFLSRTEKVLRMVLMMMTVSQTGISVSTQFLHQQKVSRYVEYCYMTMVEKWKLTVSLS